MKIEKKPSDNFQNYCITDPPNGKVENLINPVKLILTGPDSCDFSQRSRPLAAGEARVEMTAPTCTSGPCSARITIGRSGGGEKSG
jgi:hypothetical protein